MLPQRHYTVRELSDLTGINYFTLLRRIKREEGWLNLKTNINDIPRVPESLSLRLIEKWTQRGRR